MRCLSCVLVISFIAAVGCYSSGAPQSACQTLGPGSPHYKFGGPKISSAPYTLSFTTGDGYQTDRFTPGSPINGTLKAYYGNRPFKGFMIRVFSEGNPVMADFKITDSIQTRTMNCSYQRDTLTHINRNTKSAVEFTWPVPWFELYDKPSIEFRWAVVESKYWFWVNQTVILHNSDYVNVNGGERGYVSMVTVLLAVLPALFLM